MAELILHHYPSSPFSEKIRLVLGHKQLAWKSVIVPSTLPKPDVGALTGGYRKTPFLQIGSHIYCDTALICDVLEQLQPEPALYPAAHKGLARVVAQWAEERLFWAAMSHNFQPRGAAQVFGGGPPEQWGPIAKAFSEDRARMRTAVPRLPLPDASAAYRSYLRRLSDMLHEQPYLLGPAPCVADFAAYHPLWFTRTQASLTAGILEATPAVLAWMDRMAAIGHGRMEKSSAAQAIALCAAAPDQGAVLRNTPFQDEHGIALGSRVSIASDSFGPEPSTGELVAATRMHYTLRRVDERAGVVHVHFPRIGYVMKKDET
jgi:glutathione S-transferase